MTVLFQLLLCCALVVLTAEGSAQSWPSRPVKLAVPTGPGAATDVMARLLAESVSRTLGQPIIVENMPGASGILAHQSVARATPDGYTLLFTNTSGMAINLISFKQLPYDPMRDFGVQSRSADAVGECCLACFDCQCLDSLSVGTRQIGFWFFGYLPTPPGTMERHPALPAAPIGRSLNDRGRRRERSSSVQVFRWPVLQVASPTRDECSSRASVICAWPADRSRRS